MFFGKKKDRYDILPKGVRVPESVAIIMDGNGRWAQKRGLMRSAGHAAGARAFKNITDYCVEIGIKYLTVYVFSTENNSRPKDEVDAIMKLFGEYLDECIEKIDKYNVEIRFIGDHTDFPPEHLEKMAYIEKHSSGRPMRLSLAVNYGGREELVHSFNRLRSKTDGPVTARDIERELYTSGTPDPDLIIRTAGEQRLSGFLLWQCSYSEFWFTETLWPDFNKNVLNRAIVDYSNRKRRFGRV